MISSSLSFYETAIQLLFELIMMICSVVIDDNVVNNAGRIKFVFCARVALGCRACPRHHTWMRLEAQPDLQKHQVQVALFGIADLSRSICLILVAKPYKYALCNQTLLKNH